MNDAELKMKSPEKISQCPPLYFQSTSNLPSCAPISDSHTNLIATSPDSSTISVETFNPTPVVMSRDNSKKDVMSSQLVQNYVDDAIKISNPIDNKGVIIDNINIDTICDDDVKSSSGSKTKNDDYKSIYYHGDTTRIQKQDIYTHPKTGLQRTRKWESVTHQYHATSDSLNIPFNPSLTEKPDFKDQRLRDKIRRETERDILNIPFNPSPTEQPDSKDQRLRDKTKRERDRENERETYNGLTMRTKNNLQQGVLQDIYTDPKTGLQRTRKW
jgi:hypothetical protein